MTERSEVTASSVEAGMIEEQQLTGGHLHKVVRVGATVRRPTGPWSPVVHALLAHLAAVGFDGAPRFLGIDEQGREILSFVGGDVLDGPLFARAGKEAVSGAAGLIRRFHTAAASFTLPDGLSWPYEVPLPGEPRIPLHNDLAPRNTIYRAGRAVALVDWDFTAAGPAVWDLAHAAWHFVPLVNDEQCGRLGWAAPPDRRERLRVLANGYGLADNERRGFTGVVVARMEATAKGIDDLAATGAAAFVRLVAQGVPVDIRAQANWLASREVYFDDALR